MPLEIRELVIRAVVDDSRAGRAPEPENRQGARAIDPDTIIEECVRQVLKILKRSGER